MARNRPIYNAFSLVQGTQDESLLSRVEAQRLGVTRRLDQGHRAAYGQFLTPAAVAHLMAAMFARPRTSLNILDPGAGVGSLSAALVDNALGWSSRPKSIKVTAYEVNGLLTDHLLETMEIIAARCRQHGIKFEACVRPVDFINAAVGYLRGNEEESRNLSNINAVIVNPPYHKLNSESDARLLLRQADIEISNLYAAFVWLSLKILEPGGELAAITPRSFCNGVYFRGFRNALLDLRFDRIHIFESRARAFLDDDVLQENIIYHGTKMDGSTKPPTELAITSSYGPEDDVISVRHLPYEEFVHAGDGNAFFHIPSDAIDQDIGRSIGELGGKLNDLDLAVSTGRVVDFRATHLLRQYGTENTVPLIYPRHLAHGLVSWPVKNIAEPQAILTNGESSELILPTGFYVVVKRFTAKEEPRRVVAAVYDPSRVPANKVAFENHLNFFHRHGVGLNETLGKGLCAYLNSTFVDKYFRQFSGHTQVNATDLRSLPYPSAEALTRLGGKVEAGVLGQAEIDRLVQEEALPTMTERSRDSAAARQKVDQALEILKALDVPREQQNERSALTLLALLDLRPKTRWSAAASPLRGITEMMNYFEEHYGKKYAPNTRETVRRQTVHQFVQLGLAVLNPDNPERAINSPDNRYQTEGSALQLFRTFGTASWTASLETYLASSEAIRSLHPRARQMRLIPLQLQEGKTLYLTSGGQNLLIKDIVDEFCPRFTQAGVPLYVGDALRKDLHWDREQLHALGIDIDRHDKMPDLVIYVPDKNWLVLVEAVTSHGPVNIKRHNELKKLFATAKAGIVFVTAFLSKKAMAKYASEIAWETEVWVADSPDHLIHYDGERFLGPYPL